jgi:hypothetical protein
MVIAKAEFRTMLAGARMATERVLFGELAQTRASGRIAAALRGFHQRQRRGGEQLLPLLTIRTAWALGRRDLGPVRASAAIEALRIAQALSDGPQMAGDPASASGPRTPIAVVDPDRVVVVLQTLAFDILAHSNTDPDAAICAKLCAGLARAGLAAQQRASTRSRVGVWLKFSVEAGGLLGSPSASAAEALEAYGLAISAASEIIREGFISAAGRDELTRLVAEAKEAIRTVGLSMSAKALWQAAEFLSGSIL